MLNFKTPTVQIRNSDNDIFCLREDLLPFSFGGNKVRIASEYIADMKKQGKNCMVGYGNYRSNLNRALSGLCKSENIPCYIVSPSDDDGTFAKSYNSTIAKDCDAEFRYCEKKDVKTSIESLVKHLQSSGYSPYYINGNSSGVGNGHIPLLAYYKVYKEICGKYDYIFLPTGTGMTQGGLLVGKEDLGGNEKIIGISVARDAEKAVSAIENYIKSFAKKIKPVAVPEITVTDKYLCGGYGKYNGQIEQVIFEQMRTNGMPLDPTYTGKAFYGMLEYLKTNNIVGKKVLFIHTGGTPLYFDYLSSPRLIEVKNFGTMKNAVSLLHGNLPVPLDKQKYKCADYAEKIHKHGKMWCHFVGDTPVSILAGYCNDTATKTSFLSILAVDERYRGKGLGTALLNQLEITSENHGMRKVTLEVRKTNVTAKRLYERHGYTVCDDMNDKYLMVKDL